MIYILDIGNMEPTLRKKKEYFLECLGRKGIFFCFKQKYFLPDHSKFQFELEIMYTTRSVP